MSDSISKTRDKRVKPRFKIQVHARIKAQLIGSSSKFPFVTENISESGLLVNHEPGSRHAFNKHSILEVWVSNDADEQIFFFAKYVRKASDTSFAIKIIDIDGMNSKKYQDFIDAHRGDAIPDETSEDDKT
ncbi:MAG: PilZ domain-containing protein [Pseudobdellovibrionaceae bacterium]|uniref:PilZ domain-containing protein n=1 Tax=Oligoflexus sp. TaxID=1971216 RepID=UPI0027D1B7D1|nr:PilZ domain-containing protein [Oligoflexus sp.]MDQ3232271.1 PilZ domain-containing protein [Pseudobdellovibrionaceae bacterium]HYX35872.1 PilZ domain-containing protein [Oligoflexus sp.]